ncbi:MAG: Smr/MutS family protein [Rubricoccaceae bacterium]
MLDLHGARVADAEDLAETVVMEAARRGRSTVRLVHGSSTTEQHADGWTIKTALHAMLDDGVFAPYTTSAFRADGHLLLGIAPARQPVADRLTLRDIW